MSLVHYNQKGFGAVEAILVIFVMAVIGSASYYVWHSKQNANKHLSVAGTATANNKSNTQVNKSAASTAGQNQYLKIKEWQGSIKLSSSIDDATYHIVGSTAWLSTKSLDSNAQCSAYYSSSHPSFQGITRYNAADQVDILDNPNDGDNYMPAAQAAKQDPVLYRQLGRYVFYLNRGSGLPCEAQTADQTSTFADAFKTLSVE